MAEEKKFYWIKLKESFMSSDAVDFLMGQKNGAEYVMLYQKLCLMTIKTEGRLERQMGKIVMPYDAAKIQRDCKYFSYNTVVIALELFKQMELVVPDENGVLEIVGWRDLVGSETKWAEIKRGQREEQKQLDNVQSESKISPKKVHIDIEKDIDIYNNLVQNEQGESVPFKQNCSNETTPSTLSENSYLHIPAVELKSKCFDKFYKLYPRHQGKAPAEKAYYKILRGIAGNDRIVKKASEILKGLEAANEEWAAKGIDKQYIPLPATWLNGERWNDEHEPPPGRASLAELMGFGGENESI